jgi:predicted RNase H-like HicB family nuclease
MGGGLPSELSNSPSRSEGVGEVPNVVIPVHVEPLEEGGYLAVCDAIQGCHAEGESVEAAFENIEDVARILLDLQREEGLPLDPIFEGIESGAVIRAELIENSSRG